MFTGVCSTDNDVKRKELYQNTTGGSNASREKSIVSQDYEAPGAVRHRGRCGNRGRPALIRSAKAADPIRIGVLSPVTGAWTVYGQAHSRGFELAVEEINAAGGVLGRPIEMILADYQTDQRLVVEQANRLLRQEKVDLLAGTFSSADRNAAGPVVKAADKILLYPTWYEGQIKDYYPGVCNKNIFMFGPEPTQQVWPFMEHMVSTYGKKFYMIGSDYAWPKVTNLFTKEKLQELGGEVVAEVYIPFNTPQYELVLRDIRERNQISFSIHLPGATR